MWFVKRMNRNILFGRSVCIYGGDIDPDDSWDEADIVKYIPIILVAAVYLVGSFDCYLFLFLHFLLSFSPVIYQVVAGLFTFLRTSWFYPIHRFNYFSLVPCRLLILQHYTFLLHSLNLRLYLLLQTAFHCRLVGFVRSFDFRFIYCFHYCCCFYSSQLFSLFVISTSGFILFLSFFILLFAGENVFARICISSTKLICIILVWTIDAMGVTKISQCF